MTVRENVVAIPASEIPPGGEAVFSLQASDGEINDGVMLRFEAILRHETEAGYDYAARVAVNGVLLDESRFPSNWQNQRKLSLPNINSDLRPLYKTDTKAWAVRYDCDGYPPEKSSRYYSPEMADKYVFMFPLGGLLKAGENRIKVENLNGNRVMAVLSPATEAAGRVDDLRITRRGETSLELAWNSDLRRFEIDYRAAGEENWRTIQNVLAWENPYNVIMLEPCTSYKFRLRAPFHSVADLHGKIKSVPLAATATIEAETLPPQKPRIFAGMQLTTPRPLPGGLGVYPCIESHDGFLWIVDGSLRLIKLDPQKGEVVFKRPRPLADWPLPPPQGYMGIPDTTIHDGKLWVTFHAHPPGKAISHGRQYVLSYDFASDEVSPLIVVEPSKPGCGTWEGGIQSWRGELWVMHMDAWDEGSQRRTKIVLRTLADGKFGPAVVYENCPTVFPYGPSISVFKENLVLFFSDLSGGDGDLSREPLFYAVFDGREFSRARNIHDNGRSRYAKGVQVGERFFCAYKCSAPYHKQYGYKYHDIAVSVFVPGSDGEVQTVMYENDRKYNSSPDVALHDGRLFLVYNKLEHLYGDNEDPAMFYGNFIGAVLADDCANAKKE